ncbi:hypothetical protein BCR43DRAFT_263643 [Syncephalastrum racemosum]|uniref:Uncharacterized protein n=1 Tax=Syncephalastrum racemosum TaxID=13706 RepID=A0A1X2HGU0_SYNRA|nr:hypothetical protein BCR43DRAFT_263643 [Syncephalastrum racemosum]
MHPLLAHGVLPYSSIVALDYNIIDLAVIEYVSACAANKHIRNQDGVSIASFLSMLKLTCIGSFWYLDGFYGGS